MAHRAAERLQPGRRRIQVAGLPDPGDRQEPERPDEIGTQAHGRAGRALVWSFANAAAARFGTLAIGIVLARVLGPEEFGAYAVAFVALMAILSFNELGVSLAIVRWADEPSEIAPTVATISVVMSAALTGAAALLAPWFAEAMGDPGAAGLVRLLSLCVLINGIVATPAALMQRLFRQDQRFLADQVNVWAGAILSVALALSGLGALSLVLGRLAGAGLSGLLLLHYSPLPYRFGLDRRHIKALLAFGLPLAATSVVVFLVGFVDQLVVGSALGSVALGYYVLAGNLASWPVALLSQPLRSVAPALFARLQHDPAQMRSTLGRVLRPLSAIALPVCIGLAVGAPDLVRIVYGEQWLPAGTVLRWLAVLAVLRILFELAYDFLVVLGRSASILRLQLVWIAALLPALWLGVRADDAVGASAATVAVAGLISAPLYLAEFRRCGIGPGAIGRWLARPLLIGAGSGALAAAAAAAAPGALPSVAACAAVMTGALVLLVMRVRADVAVFRPGRLA